MEARWVAVAVAHRAHDGVRHLWKNARRGIVVEVDLTRLHGSGSLRKQEVELVVIRPRSLDSIRVRDDLVALIPREEHSSGPKRVAFRHQPLLSPTPERLPGDSSRARDLSSGVVLDTLDLSHDVP